MQVTPFFTDFDAANPPSELQWYCEPAHWRVEDGCLVLHTDAETDFWQRTHYGFQADNGHFYYTEATGDFTVTTHVRFAPAHQYDQAGLMLRLSADCWLKTSVEYEPELPNRLGAVVTNHGYSDWSTQDVGDELTELSLRVRREGRTYTVEYSLDEESDEEAYWSQIRQATLLDDDGDGAVMAGLYACSPKAAGFTAWFDYLQIAP